MKLTRAGFASFSVSYALLAYVHRLPELLASATLSSFGQSALRPALTAQITHNSRRDEQGMVLGITQSLTAVAQIVAPLLTGFLIGHQLIGAWAWMAAAAAAVGLLLNLRQKT